jgi:hypothetical protein
MKSRDDLGGDEKNRGVLAHLAIPATVARLAGGPGQANLLIFIVQHPKSSNFANSPEQV